MSRQAWGEAIFWVTEAEAPVVNTIVDSRLFSDVIVPAAYMSDGRVLRLIVAGSYKATITSTIKLSLKLDGIVLAASGLIPTLASPDTKCWSAEYMIQTRANGRNGVLLTFGDATVGLERQLHSSSGLLNPASVTKDLLVEQALGLYGQWGNADVGNVITGMTYVLESLN